MFVAGSFPVALPASTTSPSPGTPTGARMLLFVGEALIKSVKENDVNNKKRSEPTSAYYCSSAS